MRSSTVLISPAEDFRANSRRRGTMIQKRTPPDYSVPESRGGRVEEAFVTRRGEGPTGRCPSLQVTRYCLHSHVLPRSKALLCYALRVWYRSCSEHGGAAPE